MCVCCPYLHMHILLNTHVFKGPLHTHTCSITALMSPAGFCSASLNEQQTINFNSSLQETTSSSLCYVYISEQRLYTCWREAFHHSIPRRHIGSMHEIINDGRYETVVLTCGWTQTHTVQTAPSFTGLRRLLAWSHLNHSVTVTQEAELLYSHVPLRTNQELLATGSDNHHYYMTCV